MENANDMSSELAIVVFSCDKYSDLWEPLFDNIRQKWPDCPYKIYLVSNFVEYKGWNMVTSICVGDDISWSSNAYIAISKIPENYILTTFDDLFFKRNIQTRKIEYLVKEFVCKNMNYLRLNPLPLPTQHASKNSLYGIIDKGDIYRSSAVFSIWKKCVFLDILRKKENAWEFELYGSERTDKYDAWYATYSFYFPFYNLVIKGKYDYFAYTALCKEGIKLSEKRCVMKLNEIFIRKIQEIRTNVFFKVIPWKYRRQIRNFFSDYHNCGK